MPGQEQLNEAAAEKPRRKTSARGIFAVDRKSWAEVCALGMNPAVAYLVIATGTGLDMVTSKWSAKAMQTYTGLRYNSATEAISVLEQRGFLSVVEKGERTRKYRLTLFDNPGAEPDWIWLPNSIVTGAADEVPPVKLLRQANRVAALKLFVDLYHGHDLINSGGIECRGKSELIVKYSRTPAGEHGIYDLWALKLQSLDTIKGADLEAWRIIHSLGLFEIVEHLVDAPDGEIIHPLPLHLTGEPIEMELARAVAEAGRALAPEWHKSDFVIPVARRIPDATVIGVIRMKYRPQTALTAKWLESLGDLRDEINRYRAMVP